jgi:endonuclease YncB( thermonuclease family)
MENKVYFDSFRRDVKEILDIHDGDTLTAMIYDGFDDYSIITFRLDGINTAELTSKTEERKILANNALAYVKAKLAGKQIGVESIKFKDGGFSRYLGVVYYLDNGEWKNLNQELLDVHLAQVYYKGASKEEGDF